MRAHLVMGFPIPTASNLDKTNKGSSVDYNYMANLLKDGSNFPCRGNHLKTSAGVVSTLKAEQSYDLKQLPHNESPSLHMLISRRCGRKE